MKLIAFLVLAASCFAAPPDWVMQGDGKSLPSYFRYKPTGGIFFRDDTPKRRLEWMLSRQKDVLPFAQVAAGNFDPRVGQCLLRARAVIYGIEKVAGTGPGKIGTFRIALARERKTNDGHAFAVWTARDGAQWALDSAEWQTIMPLSEYVKFRDLSLLPDSHETPK